MKIPTKTGTVAFGFKSAGLCLMAFWLSVAAEAAEGAAGQTGPINMIIDRWLEALGGARKIERLRTVEYRCLMDFGQGAPPLELQVRGHAGGVYRYDYELPAFGRLTQAFNGEYAWQRNERLGFGQLTAEEHTANLVGIDFRAPLRSLSLYAEKKLLPDVTIDGQVLQVLELTDAQGDHGRWYFDRATGLRTRIELESPAGIMVIESSDFREVRGIGLQEAYRIVRTINDNRVVVTMREVRYNDDLDPALFAPSPVVLENNRAIERILRRNRENAGEAALRQIQTRVTRELIEITSSGIKIPTVITQKRPNLIVMEQDVPGMGPMWQGYDGHTGWAWGELTGYRVMQGPELLQMLGNADLNGPLHLSSVCPLRRLLERTYEKDRTIIGVALANMAGPVGNFYFDEKTFNLVRVETFLQAGADGQLKVVADMSDFRTIDGVTLPFRTQINNPALQMLVTIDSIQHNIPLDEAIFEPRKE